jgi:hypothetical protein
MTDLDPIESLRTRREVRDFIARELGDVLGSQNNQTLPPELSSLLAGNDGEVMQAYRSLEQFCESRIETDAMLPSTSISDHLRDLFAKGLHRMNELPPDARGTLHVKRALATPH